MSTRSRNAWIKAARKAATKTGGLSLPAARKAYKAAKERLGREPRAIDVKRHPRITRDVIKQGAREQKKVERAKKVSRPARKPESVKEKPKKRVIRSLRDFERYMDFSSQEDEYSASAEY